MNLLYLNFLEVKKCHFNLCLPVTFLLQCLWKQCCPITKVEMSGDGYIASLLRRETYLLTSLDGNISVVIPLDFPFDLYCVLGTARKLSY